MIADPETCALRSDPSEPWRNARVFATSEGRPTRKSNIHPRLLDTAVEIANEELIKDECDPCRRLCVYAQRSL